MPTSPILTQHTVAFDAFGHPMGCLISHLTAFSPWDYFIWPLLEMKSTLSLLKATLVTLWASLLNASTNRTYLYNNCDVRCQDSKIPSFWVIYIAYVLCLLHKLVKDHLWEAQHCTSCTWTQWVDRNSWEWRMYTHVDGVSTILKTVRIKTSSWFLSW